MCGMIVWAVAAAGAAPPETTSQPDADFLEFLGSWQTGEDRWIDPVHAAEMTNLELAPPSKIPASSDGPVFPRQKPRDPREDREHKGGRPVEPSREATP